MDTLQPLLAVMTVLGLLGATLWWLRRRGLATIAALPSRRQGILHAVERMPLSATHTLHLVRIGERGILLACSPSGCQVVESAPWSHYAAPAEAKP